MIIQQPLSKLPAPFPSASPRKATDEQVKLTQDLRTDLWKGWLELKEHPPLPSNAQPKYDSALKLWKTADGQTLIHVVLPLVRPALAALAILTFTFVWNDYFWAIVLTQSDAVKPVTAGLSNLRGEWVSAWNLVAAATIMVAVPPVVMFFLMQRHFIAGLTAGAVKG